MHGPTPAATVLDAMSAAQSDIDAYLAKAPAFAVPILEALRAAAHEACPDIEETLKWSHPSFEKDGLLFGAAAFKKHVGWGFWKAGAMSDPAGLFVDGAAANPRSLRATSVDDLPPRDVLVAYIREAAELNARGVAAPKRAATCAPQVSFEPPDWFLARIAAVPAAQATWDGFAPTYRKEYVERVVTAKREATREKRMDQAVEWMAEGKKRNWKYM